ncbi:tyrosine-type recombinase/integrase [Nocardioides sp. KIGAM211]|jgi:integrase|uniref:Tyrosine-type recombinase/integrase n=2 Tax=Nocardioides TaxID=1839 RepID=A0A7X0RJZ7_9ACTN|nr:MULTISPECIES: tyrosine-type recombinase/integrase [Nocardioides]KQY62288.1 integrase [Nocardioides sp. Root140]KRF19183.1 integrase [Nocardioides sp. Soil796]MBB6629706.1 tyrosine-type recombinase/integrase [Nocardioides luti]MDO3397869.1 tyrosine-type recombinase/integrase [Nocardioides cremeus]
MTTPTTPTTLREWLDEYLAMRRALGFQLDDVERQVGLFLAWLEARGQTQTFTIDDAVRWARLNPDAHPSWWATRLSLVRRFANHLNASGVDVPAIPSGLLPARKPRAVPFIYSQADIDALLAACDTTFTDERIAATVRTVIGLLAATGLRIGEALRLRVDDIDTAHDLLVIQEAKSAERLVPIHPTTTAALLQYIALPARTATHPDPHGPVFVTSKGTSYAYGPFQARFKRVREAAGLTPRGRARPRLHDLRHTFATAHMTTAYAYHGDPERVLTLLATWLGHSDAAHTYWYLTATGELMARAAGLLEHDPEGDPS